MIQENYFKDVTLLITHYNRSKSLERLLKSFHELNCTFEDIVVSDDGSKQEHLTYITDLHLKYNFRLITTPKNKGLGNNINKGQDSVVTPYTLYIQEDFIPKPDFPGHFRNGLNIMLEDNKLDMISFYAYEFYPYSKPYKLGFSEKQFKTAPWFTNNLKFYLYSDHPHLRRSSFLKKFGRYAEGLNVDKTEMLMSLSFIKNNGKALFFDDHYGLLIQDNEQHKSSTASYRKSWKNKNTAYIQLAKCVYAKIKFVKLSIKLFTTRKHYS